MKRLPTSLVFNNVQYGLERGLNFKLPKVPLDPSCNDPTLYIGGSLVQWRFQY